MKNILPTYKTENKRKETMNFWLSLLRWLKLLVLSYTRERRQPPGVFIPVPIDSVINQLNIKTNNQNQTRNNKKLSIMKSLKRHIKWGIMLFLTAYATNAMAQYPNTGNQSVCLNATEPYGVTATAGSTYQWGIIPLTGANGTITPGATSNLITVTWTSVGTAKLWVIETSSAGCVGDTTSIIVTVNPLPTATVSATSPICSGTDAVFTITGTAGDIVTYNINGGANQTVTIGAGGTATVTVTGATANQTLNLVSVSRPSTSCSQTLSGSATVTVNPKPVTSPITHN